VEWFSPKHTVVKADFLYDLKIYCLQVCAGTFQPENLTGWGSEGVKNRRWAGKQKPLTAHLAGHLSNTKQWDTPQSTDLQLDPLSHEVKVLLHEAIDKQHQFPQGHSVQTFTASKGEYSVHLSIHPNMYWTLNHEEQCMDTPKLCGHWPYHFRTAVKAGGCWSKQRCSCICILSVGLNLRSCTFLTCWKMLDPWVYVLMHVTGRVDCFRYVCVCVPSRLKDKVLCV